MRKVLWVILGVVLVVGGLVAIVNVPDAKSRHERALFSEWREHDMGRAGWAHIGGIPDAYGNWAFFDPELNFIFVVKTNDPSCSGCFSNLNENDGIVFEGTPVETRVWGKRDMLEVAITNNKREVFHISKGVGKAMYKDLRSYGAPSWVFNEISRHYAGDDEAEFRKLVDQLRKEQVDE